MRIQPNHVTPRVRPLPKSWNHDVQLTIGSVTFEMTTAEAHALADDLVDAAETRPGAGGV